MENKSGLYRVEYQKDRESAKLSTNVAADSKSEAEGFVSGTLLPGGHVSSSEYLARIDEVAA